MLGFWSVRFVPFLIGTAIGFIPGAAAVAFLGGNLLEWQLEEPDETWLLIALLLVLAAALFLVRRGRSRGAEAHGTTLA